MAPAHRYASPITQLVPLMADARRRGLEFEAAWEEALRPGKTIVMSTTQGAPETALRWPTDKTEREGWRVALKASREMWRRAYERRPATRSELAVAALAGELGLSPASLSPVRPGPGIGVLQAVA